MTDHGVIARWFIAIGAFVYATGFLVAINYADYLGASGMASELFRAEYVLIGLLCLSLPTIVVGTAYGLMELHQRQVEEAAAGSTSVRRVGGAMIVLAFNLLLTFYLFVMFAPRGYMRDRPWLIWLVFAVTLFTNPLIDFISRAIKDSIVETFKTIARWVLCILVVLGLDVVCFWGMGDRLLEVLVPRGLYFLLFVGLITYMVCRLKWRSASYRDPRARGALWGLAACSLSLFYVLMIYAFAYGVYPEIAASRGGGDYAEAPRLVITYWPDAAKAIPPAIASGGHSQPVVLIEETAENIVVADPTEAGGPAVWRTGKTTPTVIAISRRAVLTMVSSK